MARTTQTIYNEMIANFVARVQAVMGVTLVPSEWSKTDLRGLIFYIVATSMAFCEQLYDLFVTQNNAAIDAAPPQTDAWFKKKMLAFQYDATTPQVLTVDTSAITYTYPTVDAAKQIIKYCSVVPGAYGITVIKVAKDNAGVPDPLGASELSAAQSYVNVISAPGLYYVVQSKAADKLYMALDVYYTGQYSSVIQTNVSTAISTYLTNIPFNGYVTLSDLEVAIKQVIGVQDVVFIDVQARRDADSVFSGTPLVSASAVVQRQWATDSGYIIVEVSPNGLTDPRPDGSGLNNLNLIPL